MTTTSAFVQRARSVFTFRWPLTSAQPPLKTLPPLTPKEDITEGSPLAFVTAVAPDGTKLWGGLTWDVASGAETPVLNPHAPAILRQGSRRTKLPRSLFNDPSGDRPGSLLLNLATSLIMHHGVTAGPWIFMTEIPVRHRPPLLWFAIADLDEKDDDDPSFIIIPRPGTEEILDTADETLAAVQRELDITEIAGLAVRWLPEHASLQPDQTHRGSMIEGFAHIAQTVPLCDVNCVACHDDQPRFAAPKHIPIPLIGWVSAIVSAVCVSMFGVVPVIQEWLKEPPPPPPDMVTVHPAQGAFGEACLSGLNDWWPRIVGWDVQSIGCALPNHVPKELALPVSPPPSVTTQPLVIWRELRPVQGRNTVLAQSAAGQAIATWPHEIHRDDFGDLVLWKTVDLPLVSADETQDFRSIDLENLRSQLAILWAHAPESVRLVDREMTILQPGPPREAFERVARIPDLMPLQFSQPGRMTLTSVDPRQILATDFHQRKKTE